MQHIISQLLQMLLSLPAILLALSVHEMCHGFAAYKLGDPTAKYDGRLSMNPLRHIDPIGFIALLFFRVGWAKPVMVDSRYFKKPKRDMALCALAGPLSNFVLAFISMFLYVLFIRICEVFSLSNFLSVDVIYVISMILQAMITINLGLCFFNLIPIPPLDGSKILYAFLPNRIIYKIAPYERYSYLILLILLWTDILSVPISFFVNLFLDLFFMIAQGVLL